MASLLKGKLLRAAEGVTLSNMGCCHDFVKANMPNYDWFLHAGGNHAAYFKHFYMEKFKTDVKAKLEEMEKDSPNSGLLAVRELIEFLGKYPLGDDSKEESSDDLIEEEEESSGKWIDDEEEDSDESSKNE